MRLKDVFESPVKNSTSRYSSRSPSPNKEKDDN